jgi:hypothetical protein
MSKMNYTGVPLYHIDYFHPKTGKLSDISEEGYPTLELCQTQIESENNEDNKFKQELLEQYEEKLKNFVLDLDTSDRQPANPLLSVWRYDKKPHQYIHDENGHHEITEHCIKDLFTLNASAEQIEKVNGILNGTIDPETFQSVQDWISQCFNKPSSDEMKMRAINQILEGYGIESVRTSKWKNGYWCDILCTYVNMGDSYITTVIHHRKHGFMVSSIGDVIEKNKHII